MALAMSLKFDSAKLKAAKRSTRFRHDINNASTKELKPIFEQRVSHKAHVRVDKWRAYIAIKKDYPYWIDFFIHTVTRSMILSEPVRIKLLNLG
jgi:hypothetical protein